MTVVLLCNLRFTCSAAQFACSKSQGIAGKDSPKREREADRLGCEALGLERCALRVEYGRLWKREVDDRWDASMEPPVTRNVHVKVSKTCRWSKSHAARIPPRLKILLVQKQSDAKADRPRVKRKRRDTARRILDMFGEEDL
jgi:hypothetical protein